MLENKFYRLILIIVATYILTVAVIYFDNTSYIYFPDKTDFYTCSHFTDAEKIEQNGTRMYYKKNGNDLVVVYHGNAGRACDRTYYDDIFAEQNVSYILVEYAGYAEESRKPSRENILKDIQNVAEIVDSISPSTLTVIGESIGTGAASEHTKTQNVNTLILIAPFTSLVDVARHHYPFLPAKLLGKENYDNVEALQEYEGKTLIIHGTDDDIIPMNMGQELFNSLSEMSKKEFVELEGKGHNDILSAQKFFEAIASFLRK